MSPVLGEKRSFLLSPGGPIMQSFTGGDLGLDELGSLNIEIRFVPESEGWLMLVSGIGLLGVFYRRRR